MTWIYGNRVYIYAGRTAIENAKARDGGFRILNAIRARDSMI